MHRRSFLLPAWPYSALLLLCHSFTVEAAEPTPIQQLLGIDEYTWNILSIITTVILSYGAHAIAIRPERTKRLYPTMLSYVAALAWPMNGVYDAYSAIYKYFKQDAILYSSPIELPNKFFRQHLYQDNGVYLKEQLDLLDPSGRASVKNCILNGNVFLGYDDATLRMDKYAIKTKDMSISGFGSRCQYQASLHPSSIRFLPQAMIEQLVHEARGIQNNALGSLAVTVIQLAFSSYKIFVAGGNSWGKLILGIYMVMTLLQSLSRILLPTQLTVFSLRVPRWLEDDLAMTQYHYGKGGISPLGLDARFFIDQSDDRFQITSFLHSRHGFDPTLCHTSRNGIDSVLGPKKCLTWKDRGHKYIVFCLSVALPLLLGVLAGYNQHSVIQYIVLVWILSAFPFLWLTSCLYRPSMCVPAFAYLCCNPNTNIDVEYFVYAQVMNLVGVALVLSATVLAYTGLDRTS